jgi:GH24 family phage-related lysozyme (muramidase)
MGMKQRVAVSLLAISAGGFSAWKAHEGFTDTAIIPTKGDVPTLGYGSTHYGDGTRVKMGDKITREQADVLARKLMKKDELFLQKSLNGTVKLYQEEFDVYLDFIGQYGQANWTGKSIQKELLKGNYAQACKNLLKYKYSAGYDCSIPGNKICYGSWERQLDRYGKCMSVQ